MKDEDFDIVYVVNTSTGPVDVCDDYSIALRVKEYFIEQDFVDVRILTFRLRHG